MEIEFFTDPRAAAGTRPTKQTMNVFASILGLLAPPTPRTNNGNAWKSIYGQGFNPIKQTMKMYGNQHVFKSGATRAPHHIKQAMNMHGNQSIPIDIGAARVPHTTEQTNKVNS